MRTDDVSERLVDMICMHPDAIGAFVVVLTKDSAGTAVSVPEHPDVMSGLAGILRTEADKLDASALGLSGKAGQA